jgi:predicted PurR-regulated permease PerM
MSLSIDMLRDRIKKLIPPAYENEIGTLLRKLVLIWQAFLRGQLSLMVIMGLIVWIGNEILGTPQALFLGILAGLLEVIPSLGPILATIPAVILALFLGSTTSFLGLNQLEPWFFALIVIGFYVLVQAIENQLLVPYVLGDAVDLPPLTVLIGVLVGGSAFGLLGIFLATPVISSGREIFMYLYDKILEPPPEPEIEETKPSLMDTIRGFAARLPRPKLRREPVVVSDEQPMEPPL